MDRKKLWRVPDWEKSVFLSDSPRKEPCFMSHDGGKQDQDKPVPLHCPPQILHDIMEVRGYGVKKYSDPENWRTVELDRLINALLRHTLVFWENPQGIDEESGLAHYKHMACNLAFICDKMKEKEHDSNI